MPRHELTDAQWARVGPLLPANGGRGGQWNEHRPLVNGMVWRLRTGAPWRDVPPAFGPWPTVYDRFSKWSADGTLLVIAEPLLAELDRAGLDRAGLVDWTLWSIDGTVVRASRAAAGARADSAGKKGVGSMSRPTTRSAAARAGTGPRSTSCATATPSRWASA